jgi:hypothetical protein
VNDQVRRKVKLVGQSVVVIDEKTATGKNVRVCRPLIVGQGPRLVGAVVNAVMRLGHLLRRYDARPKARDPAGAFILRRGVAARRENGNAHRRIRRSGKRLDECARGCKIVLDAMGASVYIHCLSYNFLKN